VHRSLPHILSIARSQPGLGPDTEKRTVSSAHVPDLDGDRLGVQELVALFALGDAPRARYAASVARGTRDRFADDDKITWNLSLIADDPATG
jgi:hypothetical protein